MNEQEMPRGLGGCGEFGTLEMRLTDVNNVTTGNPVDDPHSWAEYWFYVEWEHGAI